MITADTTNYAGSGSVAGPQRNEALAALAGLTTVGVVPPPVTQSVQEANQFLASAAPHLGQGVNQTA